MFTPDLSVLNISLMAVIAIILAFYAIFLVKLKPTKEYESTSNRDFEKGEETVMKPKRPMKQTMPAKTKKTTNEDPASTVENQEIPEEPVESVQTRTHVEERARELTQEIQKRKKNKETKKSFFLFGKKDFEGCAHKFGYLRSLPKNTPIPDECFGCPQILECLMRPKNKRE